MEGAHAVGVEPLNATVSADYDFTRIGVLRQQANHVVLDQALGVESPLRRESDRSGPSKSERSLGH